MRTTPPLRWQSEGVTLDGKTVLLTGGTGSFGTNFLRRVLANFESVTVRVYSRDELKQSQLQERFAGEERVRWLIGDIRDQQRMTRAAQGCDVIIHAAAMKQVPACEYNPFEAVRTNVMGGQHVVDAAINAGVERVVALSTDKAVNPVNLYGATKLCMEKIVVQGNAYAAQFPTRLSCVRYGNVVGSRGSVVPLFTKLAAAGGPMTITDDRMTRFWITLDQAVDLVMYALANMHGGEVFIPKIPSMRVTDLAEAMGPGLEVRVTGIRPGEKLHELLITADESRHTVDAGDVYVVLPEHPWWTDATRWTGAPQLPDGFAYASDTNDRFLSVEELRKMQP